MIALPLGWFVFLYLALFLAGILFLWIGYEIVRARDSRRSGRDRVFCRICGSRFTVSQQTSLPECPACGSRINRAFQRGF